MNIALPVQIDQVVTLISSWFYVLFRVSSFLFVAPLFNQLSLSRTLRVVLSMLVSAALLPGFVSTSGFPDPFTALGIIAVMQQIIIGVIMGLLLRIIFETLNLAGQFAATAMQLNFAIALNPFEHEQVNVLGNFYQLLGLLTFIALHGPLVLIMMLEQSFHLLPVTSDFLSLEHIRTLPEWAGQMFVYGLSLALPVMATLLVVNTGMSVMTRLAPSLNIFSIGFPVAIFAGLITIIYGLPFTMKRFEIILKEGYNFVTRWYGMS